MDVLGLCCVLLAVASLACGQTRMVMVDVDSKKIHRLEVSANSVEYTSTSTVVYSMGRIQDMDYDFVEDRLYYLYRYWTLKSIFVNGTDKKIVADFSDIAFALAVDPYERKVFVGVEKQIIVMNMDGSNRQAVLEQSGDIYRLGLDLTNKVLYWADRGECSCLHKANYDGGNPEKIGRGLYMGIYPHAIDFENNMLYGDSFGKVYKANLDTGDRSFLASHSRINWDSEIVYDPKTDRIFAVSSGAPIFVYRSNGTLLGDMSEFSSDNKFVRINPL